MNFFIFPMADLLFSVRLKVPRQTVPAGDVPHRLIRPCGRIRFVTLMKDQ